MKKSKKQLLRERRRKQKLKSNLTWGGIGLVVIVFIGWFLWQGVRPAMGVEIEIPANYDQHIEVDSDPGPYPSDPPAGGRHYGRQFDAGFYDESSDQTQIAFPEGYLIHNLEHGYVIFWYNCSVVSDSDCLTLKAEIDSVMDDFGGIKIIAIPWESLDVPVVMTSWGRLQRFDSFDPKTASAFITANRNHAPESNAP